MELIDKSTNHLKPGEKYNLTIKECSEYFGIGEKKIRKLINLHSGCGFTLMNGSHVLVKRKAFEQFIDDSQSI